MAEKAKVKKVQISIPINQYEEVKKLWIGLGFASIAEAGRFLLMNNVAEFYRQVKKSQKAISKLEDLKKASSDSMAKLAHVQAKEHQIGETLSAKKQTSGYIEKGSFEYKRLIAEWGKQNQNFVEPQNNRGLRWWVDKDTNKKKFGWWQDGSK